MNVTVEQWSDWQWQLKQCVTLSVVFPQTPFPFKTTPYYASLIDSADPDDPILKQILPDAQELIADGYSCDPFAENASASVGPGMKQRFPDRLLAMVATGCSSHCRHCTRKHLLHKAQAAKLEDVLAYVHSHPRIREVLLSGGDPLILEDAVLELWVEALSACEQLDAIRIGTRVPVVLPMRITPALVALLARSGRVWINTQFNHPRELTAEACTACRALVEAGIPISNQSVLLKGINSDPDVMAELCAKLQRNRIRPYYIFQCDPIQGISHFRVSHEAAVALKRYLLEHLGGLAVPRVVADVPGAPCKQDIDALN